MFCSSFLGNTEAARKHAKWFMKSNITWGFSTFFTGLSEKRSKEERRAVVDMLYKRFEDLVALAPQDYGDYSVHAYMHIKKVKE